MREVLLERVVLAFLAYVKTIRIHPRERRIRTRWRTATKLLLRANNLQCDSWIAVVTRGTTTTTIICVDGPSMVGTSEGTIITPVARQASPQTFESILDRGHCGGSCVVPLADLLPPGLHNYERSWRRIIYAFNDYAGSPEDTMVAKDRFCYPIDCSFSGFHCVLDDTYFSFVFLGQASLTGLL